MLRAKPYLWHIRTKAGMVYLFQSLAGDPLHGTFRKPAQHHGKFETFSMPQAASPKSYPKL